MAKPPGKAKRKPGLASRLSRSQPLMQGAAFAISSYMRFVKATSRIVTSPDPISQITDVHTPFIGVGWHGQFLMLPALELDPRPYDALVSFAADGELVARVIESFGHGTVRGSGAPTAARMHEKGGIEAFRNLKNSLDGGRSVIVTANFLRTAKREVSRGIATLARVSGRPVVPFGIATSRVVTLNSWDKTAVNLPFSTCGAVAGEPVFVAADADDAAIEDARTRIALELDKAAALANDIAHGKHG